MTPQNPSSSAPLNPSGFPQRFLPARMHGHLRSWREGRRTLAVLAAFTAAGVVRRPLLGIPGAALAGTLLWLYRNPNRVLPAVTDMALAPADGKVIAVRQVEDAHWGRTMWEITIFLSLLNVHVQRAPFAGKIVGEEWIEGKRRPAMWPSASENNARHHIYLEGIVPATVTQVAGIMARAIVSWVQPGQELQAGDQIGIIKLGSQTLLRVPVENAEPLVKPGDSVVGGITPIAKLMVQEGE